MKEKQDTIICYHIQDRINKIKHLLKSITNYDLFIKDWVRLYAILKAMIDIGEASNDLSEKTYNMVSHIEWGKIVGMRNKISHGYATVELDIVWDAVQKEIPIIRRGY